MLGQVQPPWIRTQPSGAAATRPCRVAALPAPALRRDPARRSHVASDTVECGLASRPVTDMGQDPLWKAVLRVMRTPARCGLGTSDTVERGLASEPVAYMSQDPPWKAVLCVMRTPARCGLGISDIVECGLASEPAPT